MTKGANETKGAKGTDIHPKGIIWIPESGDNCVFSAERWSDNAKTTNLTLFAVMSSHCLNIIYKNI